MEKYNDYDSASEEKDIDINLVSEEIPADFENVKFNYFKKLVYDSNKK